MKIRKSKVALACIAVSMRCYRHHVRTPEGSVCSIPKDDVDGNWHVNEGLLYWLLDEKTTKEEAVLLSEWRNADQDQNLGTREGALINTIDTVIRKQPSPETVKLGQLVVLTSQDIIAKVKPDQISALAKVVLGWYGGNYLREFLDFLSARVNQAALTCSWFWLEHLVTTFGD